MKAKQAQWLSLTKVEASLITVKLVRIRDLPEVALLERKLLLHQSSRGPLPPEVERSADNLSIKLFGVSRSDTEYDHPGGYAALQEEYIKRYWKDFELVEHEKPYQAYHCSPEDAVDLLIGLGLDFRDENGAPLRCLKLFCRQAVAAAKGIMGKLPDQMAASQYQSEQKLQQEADAFRARKRAR